MDSGNILDFNTALSGAPSRASAEDPLRAFRDAAEAFGLRLAGDLHITGDIVRVPAKGDRGTKRSGWYVLHQDGDLVYGAYGDWRLALQAPYCSRSEHLITPMQRERMRAARLADEERIARKRAEVAAEAESLMEHARPADPAHPYLVRKGVKPHGIGQYGADLYIPMHGEDGSIINVQTISPDGTKLFRKGGDGTGYFLVGEATATLVVAEGYATAASIHEATGYQCAVAFSCHRMPTVASWLRARYPGRSMVIAADAGEDAVRRAYEAATLADGCPVVIPEGPSGTDWNDVAARDGLDAVRAAFPAARKSEIVYWDEVRFAAAVAYIIKGLLTAGALSVVYGASNSGKTFFALAIAIAVASGSPFFNRKVRPGGVLYLAAEGGQGLANRILALKAHHKLDGLPLAIRRASIDLLSPAGDVATIIRLAKQVEADTGVPCSLIVIDTLSRAIGGGDENSSVDMTAFIRNCDLIRHATGAHVMLVHHSGKDAAKGARGHSSLRAAVDTEIEIVCEDGIRTATVTKQRDMDVADPMTFHLRPEPLGRDEDGDPVTSCRLVEGPPPARERMVDDSLNASDQLALKALEVAVAREAVVTSAIWRAYLADLERRRTGLDPKADAIRMKLKRAIKELTHKHYIREESGEYQVVRSYSVDEG